MGAMDIYTVIGLAGVAGYVASYGLLQLGYLDGNGVTYSVANVVAAALVLVSLTNDFNLASAVTQVIWIAIGTGGLMLRLLNRRATIYDDTFVSRHDNVVALDDARMALVTASRTAPAHSA